MTSHRRDHGVRWCTTTASVFSGFQNLVQTLFIINWKCIFLYFMVKRQIIYNKFIWRVRFGNSSVSFMLNITSEKPDSLACNLGGSVLPARDLALSLPAVPAYPPYKTHCSPNAGQRGFQPCCTGHLTSHTQWCGSLYPLRTYFYLFQISDYHLNICTAYSVY